MLKQKTPKSERPRERLQQLGEKALSISEILAILIGTGTADCPVDCLSAQLLTTFGGISGLMEASIEELSSVRGIGPAKATLLKAAFALAKRCTSATEEKIEATPDNLFIHFAPVLMHEKQEVLLVVLVDTRGKLMGSEEVARGTLSSVPVHPREVFYPAIRRKAASIAVIHNHPSGDVSPSSADLLLTKKLYQCGQLLGISLLDHLIIGMETYTSFRVNGLLF